MMMWGIIIAEVHLSVIVHILKSVLIDRQGVAEFGNKNGDFQD